MSGGKQDRVDQGMMLPEGILRSLPAVVWATDRDLRIITCGGAWLTRRELSAAQLEGKPLADVLDDRADREPVLEAHRKALSGVEAGVAFRLAGTAYRGVVVPMTTQDQVSGCALNALDRDIVDSRCQSIADTALEVILFLRPDGTIVDVNRTAGHVDRQVVIGKPIYDFAPSDQRDKLRVAIESALDSGKPTTVELEFRDGVGKSSWQALRIGPWRMRDHIIGLIVMAADTTQRRLVIQKLLNEERLLKQMLDLQERERRLVAYEIHDGFIQDVVGARMILEASRDQLDESADSLRGRLNSAVDLLTQAIGEGRRLISELRPMIIDEMGLVDAIQFLVEEERARGEMEIEFAARVGFERLPPLLQATVFRIVREAITNARRHGHAKHADIRLTEVADHLIIEVVDDGVGFDVGRVSRDRYGLEGIRERAKLFGGGATIESKPGQGTRITVKLPTDIPDTATLPEPGDWCWTI